MARSHVWPIAALAALLAAAPAAAQTEASAPASEAGKAAAAAAAAEATKEALAILKEASDFLAAQKAYAFEAEFSYDVVQGTGEKLEFGGSRQILVRRPDRVRAAGHGRDGHEATLYYDGKNISVALPTDHAYVSVEKPGDLTDVVDYLEDELGTPVPFADFIVPNFYDDVSTRIRHGAYIGDETLLGVGCAHLAFVGEHVDFEIWVDNGEKPLIRRLVIEFKSELRHPQFRAQILKWNLAPDARDAQFVFRPAKGAERLSIVAVTDMRKQHLDAEKEKQP
jgi:hypothetical protein